MGIGYQVSFHILKTPINVINENILDNVQNTMDYFFTDLSENMNYLSLSKYLLQISSSINSDADRIYQEWILQQELKDLVVANQNYEGIFIYFPGHSKIVSTDGNMSAQMYYDLVLKNDTLSYEAFLETVSQVHYKKFFVLQSAEKTRLMYLCSNPMYASDHVLYMAGILIDYQQVEQILEEIKWNEAINVYILDEKDEIFLGSLADYEEDYSFLSKKSDAFRFTYCAVIPDSVYQNVISRLQIYYGVMLVVLFLLGMLISCFMIVRNYNPVQKIVALLSSDNGKKDVEGDEYRWIQNKLKRLLEDYSNTKISLSKRVNTARGYQILRLMEYNFTTNEENQKTLFQNEVYLPGKYNLAILFKEDTQQWDNENRTLNELIITNIFLELAGQKYRVYMAPMGRYVAALINMENDSVENMDQIKEYIEIMQDFIRKNYYYSVTSKQKLTNAVSCGDLKRALALIESTVDEEVKRNISPGVFNCLVYGLIEAVFLGMEDCGLKQIEIAYELEGKFDITPTYLSLTVKKQYGISLLDFISDRRLNYALEILSGEENIAEIAGKAEFRDSAAFIRVFKKKYGITPGQMREKMQKERAEI